MRSLGSFVSAPLSRLITRESSIEYGVQQMLATVEVVLLVCDSSGKAHIMCIM